MFTRKLLLIVILLALISPVFAITIDYTVIKDVAHPGDYLEYSLRIYNEESKTVTVSVFTPFGDLTPHSPYKISGRSEQNIDLKIQIPITEYPTQRSYPVYIEDSYGTDYNLTVTGTVAYRAVEIDNMYYNNSIYPKHPVEVQLRVASLISPKQLTIELKAVNENGTVYAHNNIETYLRLGETTLPMMLPFESTTPPGQYDLKATAVFYSVSQGNYIINVLPYTDFEVISNVKKNILGHYGTVTLENTGNTIINNQELSVPINFFARLFLITKTRGAKYSNGRLMLSINNLQPGDSVQLRFHLSYLLIYLLPFVLAGIGYFVWYYTKKVKVVKEIFDHRIEDGKLSMKTLIKVKNMSTITLRDVEVLDPIPAFTDKIKKFGTIKGKMEERGYSKFVKWIIPEIKPREEIVLSYSVSTKVGLIGSYNIYPALVEFMLDKKLYTTRSNRVIISIA